MLTLPTSVRILLATEPTDMRRGIDGLCRLVEAELDGDIYGGALFVFVSKQRDKIKILTWDAGGFVVYYKRLEARRFQLPRIEAGARREGRRSAAGDAVARDRPEPRTQAGVVGARVRRLKTIDTIARI